MQAGAVSGNSENSAISIDGLAVRFGEPPDLITALEDISIEVPEASLITMVGPSGCGKSTLLRAIADLVHADQGKNQGVREDAGAGKAGAGFLLCLSGIDAAAVADRNRKRAASP